MADHPVRNLVGLASLTIAAAFSLAGCGSEPRMSEPLTQLGNPFSRPSESGFRAMAKASCGDKSVGETTVAELMEGDTVFNDLTSALYRGDISNDEFLNQVLLAHPAANANVPATGCIIDQLAQCFAEECKAQANAEQAATEQPAQNETEELAAGVDVDPVDLPSTTPLTDPVMESDRDSGRDSGRDSVTNRSEADQVETTPAEEEPTPLP
ncbi:hypothetical protein CKO40_12530 [Halochromatium glycolicum]|uniref:Uncharacterized protein n=2 Tax=Halochromatium glycolicum TaxID=85075 RepID=A0AAJ0XAQ1_9GAMM|nr:hypothetical protein [Halochromatium glycolicum]